ncbi:Ribonuclease H1 [Coemansia sp. RSA 2603]|nr:Ribonuclease H1 [Coemansia sp. RSA 2603]
MTLFIYTNGSCINETRRKASAGIGVFFGPYDMRNVSEKLLGPVQSSRRAVLEAIRRAVINLGHSGEEATQSVVVITVNSQHAVENLIGFQEHVHCANYDLIYDIRERVRKSGYFVELRCLPMKYNNKHGEAAQILAMSAARRYVY